MTAAGSCMHPVAKRDSWFVHGSTPPKSEIHYCGVCGARAVKVVGHEFDADAWKLPEMGASSPPPEPKTRIVHALPPWFVGEVPIEGGRYVTTAHVFDTETGKSIASGPDGDELRKLVDGAFLAHVAHERALLPCEHPEPGELGGIPWCPDCGSVKSASANVWIRTTPRDGGVR